MNNYRDFDKEILISKSPHKRKTVHGTRAPIDIEKLHEETYDSAKTSYTVESPNKNYELIDLPVYGRANASVVKRKTRVVKTGRKIRK